MKSSSCTESFTEYVCSVSKHSLWNFSLCALPKIIITPTSYLAAVSDRGAWDESYIIACALKKKSWGEEASP